MFRNSLRFRLVALYLAIATVAVVFACIIGAVAIFEVDSANVRATMIAAMRDIPALLASYDGSPERVRRAEDLLQSRYQNSGVIAHVMPQPLPPPGTAFLRQRFADGPVLFQKPPPDRAPGYFSIAFSTREKPFATQTIGAAFIPRVPPERLQLKNGAGVILFADPERERKLLDRYSIFAAVFALVMLVLAWRVAEIVATQTLQPLIRTTRALNRFGDGDFTPEAVRTNDQSELGKLALAYNRAVAQITRALDERSKAEREMRQFVGDAGHQLRTPLTVIMGYLSAFASREGSQRNYAALQSMLEESRRMKALIDDLIVLAKLEHPNATERYAIDVNALAREVVASFASLAENRVTFASSASSAYVLASKSELFSALAALVDNALKYSGGSPVSTSVSEDTTEARIEIADRGPGIAQADLPKIFDRFYRGESSHGVIGTGLGLAIVRRTLERAHGSVTLENRPEGGLLCTVRLPKALQTPEPIVAA